MKRKLLGLIYLSTALYGCGDIQRFVGLSDSRSGGRGGQEADAATRAGLIDCGTTLWQSSNGVTRPEKFQITAACPRSFIEPPTPERNLDVVFLLDVTGSMKNELDAVRGGINELISLISAEKWNFRAGAVAFADVLLEEHAATANLSGLLSAMDSSNENWKAPPGFGGDAPEIGLAAIERGLAMLQEADPTGVVEEKMLVYVSDAPAKLHATYGFDTTQTIQALRDFSQKLFTQPGLPSFRLFFSSTSSRKGLIEGMPTPVLQLQQLITESKVEGVSLPFPLSTENVKSSFVAALRQGAFRTEICAISHVKIAHTFTGEVMMDAPNSIATTSVSVSTDGWRSGAYQATIKRVCTISGPQTQETRIEVP
jgi:hypothetical protein